MIKILKPASTVRISKGSSISGHMTGDVVSTAGSSVEEPMQKAGTTRVRKMSVSQSGSGRLVQLNQRLRGARSKLMSISD